MKVLYIVVICLVAAVISSEETKNHKKVLDFFKCLACENNKEAREAFKKCKELKPEKRRLIAETCKKEIMPNVTGEDETWDHMCQNPDTILKLMGCIMSDEHKKSITEEELVLLGQFKNCAIEVHKKFCHSDEKKGTE